MLGPVSETAGYNGIGLKLGPLSMESEYQLKMVQIDHPPPGPYEILAKYDRVAKVVDHYKDVRIGPTAYRDVYADCATQLHTPPVSPL
jgi:hypothetical protein